MQPYQEEYIANLIEFSTLSAQRTSPHPDFEAYLAQRLQNKARGEQIAQRNMELLREKLFPLLDHLFDASQEEISSLEEFAAALFDGRNELDVGLFCQIHRALLSRVRLQKDRNGMIRELYWLGIGYNSLCTKLIGFEWPIVEGYMSQMRLCFMEAAAYLKYFEEIQDTQTRGYILRARANVALGQFKSPSEKIRLVKYTLQILQDNWYREKAPDLPWDRFLYMTHQQMAASISRSREKSMTPQDVADVMESVYFIYEKQMAQAKEKGEPLSARITFSYDSINYYFGLDTLDGLLRKTEYLIDTADPEDYSADGMYRIISLPAFYCNFLLEYPEKVPVRTEYIDSLYARALDYMGSFPEASRNESLFFCLRQMMTAFVETESGISYGDFIEKLMMRFVPEIYVHAYSVGCASAELCDVLMEDTIDFFDDIEDIRRITDPDAKRRAVGDYARKGGLFHDVGTLNFTNLYVQPARQWFEDEYEMAHLHTLMGELRLSKRPSTAAFAPIALGHHAWYDGSQGYPEAYVRLECPSRQMVDVVGLAEWLDNVTNATHLYTGAKTTFQKAVDEAISLGGRRFSPLLTQRLQEEETARRLEHAFREGRLAAYRRLYAIHDKST